MSTNALELRTLVLQANYVPVSIFPLKTIPVGDAVTRVLNGTCRVVSEYDRKILTQNVNFDMNWPSVIVRVSGSKIKGNIRMTDDALYYRDHGLCAYCEKPLKISEITWDHVVPKSLGGRGDWENIVSACESCNFLKGNNKPVGKWQPKVRPFKPSYYQLLDIRRKYPIVVDDMSWMSWIGDWEAPIILRDSVAA